MIYVAIPYSHPDPAVRERRYRLSNMATVALYLRGHVVFNPIGHSHNLVEFLPPEHDNHSFWMSKDTPLLRRCSTLVVLCLPGWEESRGVREEILEAEDLGLRIVKLHISPDDSGFEAALEEVGL